jgi:hypothetical protein
MRKKPQCGALPLSGIKQMDVLVIAPELMYKF